MVICLYFAYAQYMLRTNVAPLGY